MGKLQKRRYVALRIRRCSGLRKRFLSDRLRTAKKAQRQKTCDQQKRWRRKRHGGDERLEVNLIGIGARSEIRVVHDQQVISCWNRVQPGHAFGEMED